MAKHPSTQQLNRHYRAGRTPSRAQAARPPRLLAPRALRRPGLIILGYGDIGQRFAQAWATRFRIIGVTRSPAARPALHSLGARWLGLDLDDARACRRLSGLAAWVVHAAPPPATGTDDPRTRHALAALHRATLWVYLSTTGVYGDCGGAPCDETRPVAPRSARAIRRVAAERQLRRHAARGQARVFILRVPGIYAAERLPQERLTRRTPALLRDEDVITNHIHATDLARLIFYALYRGRSARIVHAVDDLPLPMADYFDAVAAATGLTPPPRLPRHELEQLLTPMQWSFMSESRHLLNHRLTHELRCRLRWPSTLDFLAKLGSGGVQGGTDCDNSNGV